MLDPEDQDTQPPAAPAPAPEPKPKSDGKKGPEQWRDALGTPRYAFAPAELLHHWGIHKAHANGEKRLTKAEYEEAIKAARVPDKAGEYHAHEPALGDYEPDGKPRA
jgi:hypothetical protein